MSTATTLLRRIWGRLRNPSYFVGKDLEGNKYFEYPNPNDGFGRAKRVVRYRRGYDMWTYIAGDKRLPVQWSSWLSHTRSLPPTLQELQADLMRQERIRLRVAMLEAADKNTLANASGSVAAIGLPTMHTTLPTNDPSLSSRAVNGQQGSEGISTVATARTEPASLPKDSLSSDQPEPWTPHIFRRSG